MRIFMGEIILFKQRRKLDLLTDCDGTESAAIIKAALHSIDNLHKQKRLKLSTECQLASLNSSFWELLTELENQLYDSLEKHYQ